MEQKHGPWEEVKRGFLKELKWECSDGCLVSHWRTGKEMMTFAMPLESVALQTRYVSQDWDGTDRIVQRREDDHCIKRILESEVYGCRNRGRQRKRWINTISQDLISLNLTPVDVEVRDDWRRRTRVADPSPEGFTAWSRERERDVLIRRVSLVSKVTSSMYLTAH